MGLRVRWQVFLKSGEELFIKLLSFLCIIVNFRLLLYLYNLLYQKKREY